MAQKRLPGRYRLFLKTQPAMARAYEQLGQACLKAGPLERKCAALIKLGIAVGAGLEGAVHAHVRKALEAGANSDEIRHVALLATTTIGFPRMMAALSWIDDVVGSSRS